MIAKICVGDIFESEMQTLVNTVNCVGIMGKGLALHFKTEFPEMFADYQERCQRKEVCLGFPYVYRALTGHWVLNFPTKDHWKSLSRLSDLEAGLQYLSDHYKEWGITSLAMPALGCNNGQLDWADVGPLLFRYLSPLDIPVEMYAPLGSPPEQLTIEYLKSGRAQNDIHSVGKHVDTGFRYNPAWVALLSIVNNILKEPYHYPVGRTYFHKIVYFATEEGLPTHLPFVKGSYGPFSPHLESAMTKMANSDLLIETTRGKGRWVSPGPGFKLAMSETSQQIQEWRLIIEKVTDLFLRMDGRQAEIAATVHYAFNYLIPKEIVCPSEREVVEAVMEWKVRRNPPLDPQEVTKTTRNLNMLGWITAEFSDDLVPDEAVFA